MRLYERAGVFDEQPMPEVNSEAIDFRVASELYAPARRLQRAAFQTLKVTVSHRGREVPAVGGYLLFGRDRARLMDSVEIRENLVRSAEATLGFVQRHMMKEAVIGSVRRVDRWTIPPVALREAVINAIVHADYAERGAPLRVAIFEDRIEIENPGMLPLGLTLDDLQRGVSKLRNRVIGRVFHELGLIEQWGSGIQRMNAACRDAGLPDPILEEVGHRFRITFLTEQVRPLSMTARERRIVGLLTDGKGWSTSRVAARIRLSARATRTSLLEMVQKGLLVEVGTSPQDPKRRYYLARPAE